MKIKIDMELVLPDVPDYISVKGPAGLKQDGLKMGQRIHVKDLPLEVLKSIATEWRAKLLEKAYHEEKAED